MNIKLWWVVAAILVFASIGAAYTSFTERSGRSLQSAQPVTSQNISRSAGDVPPPITRTENQLVVVALETREVIAELAPGVTYEYWTYNGTVPGPFVRVLEGDTVEVRLSHVHGDHHGSVAQEHSLAIDPLFADIAYAHEGEEEDAHMMSGMDDMGTEDHAAMGHGKHSIDLHAVEGPGGGAVLTQVVPGETHAFQFKATRPGLYVYHCASEHIPTHIANGMYGMILVEPKGGLPPVDREYYVMQGEWYTAGKVGEKGHQEFSKDKMLAGTPEYFTFNGRVGALTGDGAMKARAGEKVRIFFGVGSHIASYPHMIGAIFDKLYPEGDIISAPHRNVQTTVVPPGGAMMTDFKVEVPGKYLLVDHSLPRAIDKGAVGELVVEGVERPDIYRKVGP